MNNCDEWNWDRILTNCILVIAEICVILKLKIIWWGDSMVIREVQDRDFVQLAEMRWTHAVEDDETYGEHNTDGVTKSVLSRSSLPFYTQTRNIKSSLRKMRMRKFFRQCLYILFRQFPPRMQSVNLLRISQRCSRLKNIVARVSALDCSIM